MSRGHVRGFDSNPAQFARMGNPWDHEPVCKNQARKSRRKSGLKPCRAGLPRRVERDSRNDGDALLHYQCRQALASKLGLAKRTIVPEKSPTLAIFNRIEPARSTELTRWQLFEGKCQRAEMEGKRQAAEAAYRSSEAYRLAERRKLERQIEAMQDRLDRM